MGLEVIFFFGSNILVCARSTYSSVCQMLCWCMTEKSHLLVGGWGVAVEGRLSERKEHHDSSFLVCLFISCFSH